MIQRKRLSAERLEEIFATHGCLIPKEGIATPSCHEKSSCDCTVSELLSHIYALEAELAGRTGDDPNSQGVETLAVIREAIGLLQINPCCGGEFCDGRENHYMDQRLDILKKLKMIFE